LALLLKGLELQQQGIGFGLEMQQFHLMIGAVGRLTHLNPANLIIGGGGRFPIYRL
jgi:hypothetical protein